jgi:hypothetical protein
VTAIVTSVAEHGCGGDGVSGGALTAGGLDGDGAGAATPDPLVVHPAEASASAAVPSTMHN